MLIPQSLAYALLAGLPAEVGLYASILPLVAYAIFGTSRALAVGPVAVVSLMTAAAIGKAGAGLSCLVQPGHRHAELQQVVRRLRVLREFLEAVRKPDRRELVFLLRKIGLAEPVIGVAGEAAAGVFA